VIITSCGIWLQFQVVGCVNIIFVTDLPSGGCLVEQVSFGFDEFLHSRIVTLASRSRIVTDFFKVKV